MIPKVKKWLFAGLLCLVLLPSGCKPEGIIPRNDMENLFAEFYMADACVETMNTTAGNGLFHPDSLRVYQPIIEKQGYTEDMFRESLDYYLHRPAEMVKIFKHVRVRLEEEADRPVERMDTEEIDEEEAPEEENGEVTEKPKEGIEPEIEREPGNIPAVKPSQQVEEKPEPKPEHKKEPKPAKKRKRMTKQDLKRLEEELK